LYFLKQKKKKHSVSVWFVVPRDPSGVTADVQEEGKLNGDMLIVNPPKDSVYSASRFEEIGSTLRSIVCELPQSFDFFFDNF
jgi:hypothetical protein